MALDLVTVDDVAAITHGNAERRFRWTGRPAVDAILSAA
jgi:hypothetical protein